MPLPSHRRHFSWISRSPCLSISQSLARLHCRVRRKLLTITSGAALPPSLIISNPSVIHSYSGSMCYCTMICLGEMVSYLPIPGGHIKLAERFVNPAFSFAMGWNYWYNWCVLPCPLLIEFYLTLLTTSCVNRSLSLFIEFTSNIITRTTPLERSTSTYLIQYNTTP